MCEIHTEKCTFLNYTAQWIFPIWIYLCNEYPDKKPINSGFYFFHWKELPKVIFCSTIGIDMHLEWIHAHYSLKFYFYPILKKEIWRNECFIFSGSKTYLLCGAKKVLTVKKGTHSGWIWPMGHSLSALVFRKLSKLLF